MITTAEVKSYLKLSTTDDDTLIATLIPQVEEDAIYYMQNAFQDDFIYRDADLSFQASTGDGDKIADSDSYFTRCLFSSGMEVWVEGQCSNKGKFTVADVSSGTLTLSSTGDIITQSSTDYQPSGRVRVSYINAPAAVKPYLAQMVGWRLTGEGSYPEDHSADGREGQSITYAGNHAYPTRVLSGLNRWRKVNAG